MSEVLKLVNPFKGDKREVLAFISNVDTAFQVINPDNSDVLYKFVLTRISGEPRVAITHRNLENWEDLRTFLKKHLYGEAYSGFSCYTIVWGETGQK
jgi:hypothetical protein